jgi:hypothetical protein
VEGGYFFVPRVYADKTINYNIKISFSSTVNGFASVQFRNDDHLYWLQKGKKHFSSIVLID